MKKIILIISLAITSYSSAQFSPLGATTNDDIYRLGGLSLGHSGTPSFGSYKFLMKGRSLFTGAIDLEYSGTDLLSGQFTVWGSSGQTIQMAVSNCNGCYSNKALNGDAVLRGMSTGSLIISNEKSGNIKFVTREVFESGISKVSMLIDKYGKVGIGTETPDALLSVNGLIHTKEVKVDLVGWPDYVFEDKYNLPSLEEVELHIKEKGHLINVPSANEIETNGLELGEMIRIQQEKIEELTLYIINIKKELDALKLNTTNNEK